MKVPVLIWVDQTQPEANPDHGPFAAAGGYFRVHRTPGGRELEHMVRTLGPHAIVFDFGHPSAAALALLQRTKTDWPAIPILMLTDFHDEALAVWALRVRVWDYLVKPVDTGVFLIRLEELARVRAARELMQPLQETSRYPQTAGLAPTGRVRETVERYVRPRLSKKIVQKAVAEQCGMSVCHFSRVFRQVYGITFKEFLLQARIERAAVLFADARAPVTVTAVCYEAGFKDLAYFGRVFRRYKGMSPSEYRRNCAQADRGADVEQSLATPPASGVEQGLIELA